MVYVLYGQHTVGRSDIGLMLGEVRNDAVVGLTIASSIGPVAVHADAPTRSPTRPRRTPSSGVCSVPCGPPRVT